MASIHSVMRRRILTLSINRRSEISRMLHNLLCVSDLWTIMFFVLCVLVFTFANVAICSFAARMKSIAAFMVFLFSWIFKASKKVQKRQKRPWKDKQILRQIYLVFLPNAQIIFLSVTEFGHSQPADSYNTFIVS